MRFVLFILALLLIMPSVFAQNKNADDINVVKTVTAEIPADSRYTFDDNVMSGKVVKINKGTELQVSLITPIDTSIAKKNDVIEAALDEDLTVYGAVVAKQGSIVKGRIINVRNGATGIKNGKVSIVFDKIITTEDREINISTKKIDFVVSESSRWFSLAKSFGLVILTAALSVCTGGAALGVAALGVVYLGMEVCDTFKKGGTDVLIPAATPVEAALDSSFSTVVCF